MTRIAVLPYGQKLGPHLASMPLGRLQWPLGAPADLSGTVGDLGAQDHLLVYPKTSMHTKWNWGTAALVSVMVVEPRMIHARHLNMLRLSYRRFHRVFTHDAATLQRLPNARFLPAASTWVPEFDDIDLTKTQNASLIASARRDQDGHQLRHAVVETARAEGIDLQVMGRGYAPFEHKHEGHAPHRFSVVIENTRAYGYFTEKLVDSLLCESVPIYWGAPDIGAHFDASGMIVCTSRDEILAALRHATPERYADMRAGLMRAKAQAIAVQDYRTRAAEILRDEAQ